MRSRVLSFDQIREAKRLRKSGKSKRELALYFNVGQTTIWDNVFNSKPRKKRIIIERYDSRPCCERCGIKLTRKVEKYIPINFKVGNLCISCFFEVNGLKLKDVFDTFR
jgi:hypothetical protein